MYTEKLLEVQRWLVVDIEGIYEKKEEEERKKLTRTEKTNIRMKKKYVKLIKHNFYNYRKIVKATRKLSESR